MMNHWRKIEIMGLFVLGMALCPAVSMARDGDSFGLGLEVGDPGAWGITGKLWVDRTTAFQGAVKLGNSTALLQLDFLWHDFALIHIHEGELPFYIGVGGNLNLQTPVALAGRIPVGLSYIFAKKKVPLDLYLQVVPSLWFYNNGTNFQIYPEFGAHFYF